MKDLIPGYVNLLKTIIGSGILYIPMLFRTFGPVPTILIMIVSCGLSITGQIVYVHCNYHLHQKRKEESLRDNLNENFKDNLNNNENINITENTSNNLNNQNINNPNTNINNNTSNNNNNPNNGNNPNTNINNNTSNNLNNNPNINNQNINNNPNNGNQTNITTLALASIPRISILVDFFVFFKCFGVSTSYLIIIRELLPNVIEKVIGKSVLTYPPVVLLVFLCCIAPICFFRELKHLKYTSTIGLISIGFILIGSMVIYVEHLERGGDQFEKVGGVSLGNLNHLRNSFNDNLNINNNLRGNYLRDLNNYNLRDLNNYNLRDLNNLNNLNSNLKGNLNNLNSNLNSDSKGNLRGNLFDFDRNTFKSNYFSNSENKNNINNSENNSNDNKSENNNNSNSNSENKNSDNNSSMIESLKALGTFVFAFTCHQNLLSVQNELLDSDLSRIKLLIYSTSLTSFIIYVIFGYVNHKVFYNTMHDNILKSYPNTYLTIVLHCLYIIVMGFSYPLQLNPARLYLNSMFSQVFKRWYFDQNESGDNYNDNYNENNDNLGGVKGLTQTNEENDMNINNNNKDNINNNDNSTNNSDNVVTHYVFTVLLLLSTYALTITGLNLGEVYAFIGSTASTMICLVFPVLIYTHMDLKQNIVLTVLGTVCFLIGVCVFGLSFIRLVV